jgi:hypothetical protein
MGNNRFNWQPNKNDSVIRPHIAKSFSAGRLPGGVGAYVRQYKYGGNYVWGVLRMGIQIGSGTQPTLEQAKQACEEYATEAVERGFKLTLEKMKQWGYKG